MVVTIAPERFALAPGAQLCSVDVPQSDLLREQGVTALARLGAAGSGDLCFCDRDPGAEIEHSGHSPLVICSEAASVALPPRLPNARLVVAQDARSLFIDVCRRLEERGEVAVSDAVPRPFGVHPSASIGPGTIVHPEARVDEGAVIGGHCFIHRGTWIQRGCTIGEGTVIGATGINAYRGRDGRVRGFPHLASTIVGEEVQIGAGAVLVRGLLTSTRIGARTIIGNLCNLGHGAVLGQAVWMSVGCLVGGHCRIGGGASVGMGAALRDNRIIGAGANIGMGSVVVRDVGPGASVFGNPAAPAPGLKAGPQR